MIGLELAAALLLAAAGLSKLRRPSPTRSALTAAGLPGARIVRPALVNRGSGALELGLAAAILLVGGRAAGLLVLLSYGALALVSARMVMLERGQDCGCFAKPTPISHWHTAVNAGFALVGLAVLVQPPAAPMAGGLPAGSAGVAVLLAAVLLTSLAYLVMTALPDLLSTAAQLEAAR
ncbi:MAG TPA: MauE/DoxX family redox-associated membrane protein [Jatrophihabitans sp.]|nr:MauE/DoxX family redox-associated membrane protein [Jatrophihabitans sp.]